MDGLPPLSRHSEWDVGARRRPFSASLTNGHADYGGDCYRTRQSHDFQNAHYSVPRPRDWPPVDSRRHLYEMEEKLNQYRAELERKDQEIRHLSSFGTPRLPTYAFQKTDPQYRTEYLPAVSPLSGGVDVNAMKVQISDLESRLHAMEHNAEAKEQRIRELMATCDIGKEAEAQKDQLIQMLKQKLAEFDVACGNIEGAATHSELTITTLQKQARDAQERIAELESRHRLLVDERNAAEQRAMVAETKLSEVTSQISGMLSSTTGVVGTQGHEQTINMVRELFHENTMLRGQMTSLKEHFKTVETELQTNRDTITRLSAELSEHNRSAPSRLIDLDNLRLERDNAIAKQRELERELELWKERLEASQAGWSEARQQLEEHNRRDSVREWCAFQDQLAQMLSDSCVLVESNQEQIKERVHNLVCTVCDKNAHIKMLEQKLADISFAHDSQTRRSAEFHQRSHVKRPDIDHLEDRLLRAEAELAALDSPQEAGRRVETEQLPRFLHDLSHALQLDQLPSVENDSTIDAIMSRVRQLIRNESTSLADCRTHIHGLQHKLKNTKEQLQSRELEVELLHKKIVALEEKIITSENKEHDREEEFAKNRRLVKLVDNYKCELNEAHVQIQELRARLIDLTELQRRASEKELEIQKLGDMVRQLELVRGRQESKISDLEETIRTLSVGHDVHDQITIDKVTMMSDEVCSLRLALDETRRREQQLQDLRRVIARMLAIDANSLVIPDYEIISRLDKLILANRVNSQYAVPLDAIIDELDDDFRAGYRNAGYVLADGRRVRSRGPARQSLGRPRSPHRKIDPQVH